MNESRRFAAFVCDALEPNGRKVKGDKRKGLFFRTFSAKEASFSGKQGNCFLDGAKSIITW